MIEARLQELGINLPPPSVPTANYIPFVKTGALVFISGQLPSWMGELKYTGKLGRDFTLEEGQDAARLCILNILAQLKTACEGDLSSVIQCVRLGGFVHCTDNFKDHSYVMNKASDLIVAIFGERGRHARIAVGVNSLPFDVAVEIEALFKVKEL